MKVLHSRMFTIFLGLCIGAATLGIGSKTMFQYMGRSVQDDCVGSNKIWIKVGSQRNCVDP